MKKKDIFKEGVFTLNPLFILLLGLCPALAVTSRVDSALGMALAVILVLTLSNFTISLIKRIIPSEIRIPVYIVIIATFVTSISYLMQAYAYNIYLSLGIFLPLITVNCIIYGRAEAFASKNKVIDSILDGLSSGIGYAIAIILISFIREIVGTGHLLISNPFNPDKTWISTEIMWNYFGKLIRPDNYTFISDFLKDHAIKLFLEPVGAFLVLGLVIALVNVFIDKRKEKQQNRGEQQ